MPLQRPDDMESWISDSENPVAFQEFYFQVLKPGYGMQPYRAYEYQKEITEDESELIIINKARQTGMSTGSVLDALHRCILYPSNLDVFISLRQDQANELIYKAKLMIDRMREPWAIPLTKRQESLIEVWNGARLMAVSAHESAGRGWSGNLNLDEFAHVPNDTQILQAALSVSVREGWKIRMQSTPYGDRGEFARIVNGVKEGLITNWSLHEIHWSECLCDDSIILTDDGVKYIQDINIGDKVLSHKGRFRLVTNTRSKIPDNDIIEIKTRYSNISLRLTQDHEVFVKKVPFCFVKGRETSRCRESCNRLCDREKHQNFHESEWVEAGELTQEYFIAFPKIYRNEVKCFSDDEMKLFGYYLGDGGSSQNKIVFTFGSREKDLIHMNDIINLIKKVWGLKPHIYTRQSKLSDNYFYEVTVCNKKIAQFFQNFGTKHNKKLLIEIMNSPAKQLMLLYNYYAKADGHKLKNKERITTSSISKALSYQIREILIRNGYYSSIHYKKPQKTSIGISKENWYVVYNKNSRYFIEDDDYFYSPILSIKNITNDYNGFVHDITVDQDESFVSNCHIVHNCPDLIEERVMERCFSEEMYQQEYCCQFLDEATSMITWEMLMKATDTRLSQYTLASCPPKPASNYRWLGIDPATEKGETGFVATEQIGSRYLVRHINAEHRDPESIYSYTKSWNNSFKPHKIFVDETGMGAPVVATLRRRLGNKVEGVTLSTPNKEKLVYNGVGLFEANHISLPDHEYLKNQLHSLEKSKTPIKGVSRFTGKNKGGKDDLTWAFLLSLSNNLLSTPALQVDIKKVKTRPMRRRRYATYR